MHLGIVKHHLIQQVMSLTCAHSSEPVLVASKVLVDLAPYAPTAPVAPTALARHEVLW